MTISPPARNVYFNRVPLRALDVVALERAVSATIPDGRYWYDALCGAWGLEGGPTLGFVSPNLPLPGPIPADISGGGTHIFFNGRELHPAERAHLIATFGMAVPGRYLLNAQGDLFNGFGGFVANLARQKPTEAGGGGFAGAGGFGAVVDGGVVFNGFDGSSYVA